MKRRTVKDRSVKDSTGTGCPLTYWQLPVIVITEGLMQERPGAVTRSDVSFHFEDDRQAAEHFGGCGLLKPGHRM
jgi:hypothetical protein